MTTSASTPHAAPAPSLRSAGRVALALLVSMSLGACASAGAADGNDSAAPPSGRSDVERTVIQSVEPGGTGVALYNRSDGTERSIGVELAYVWAVMPAVFRELEIPLAHSDPRTFEVGNRGFRPRRIGGDRMSRFFRCGQSMTGSRADEYAITMSLITILTEGPDGTTYIRTTLDARGRQRATDSIPVNCETTGALEATIAELAQKLAAEKAAGGV